MLPAATVVFSLGVRWQQWRRLVLNASQFQHILRQPDLTSAAYVGHAGYELSVLSGTRRGKILEQFCKKELARLNPNSKVAEPAEGTRRDGTRRSAYHAEYDFTLDGRKIECKSALMAWDKGKQFWYVCFHGVKLKWKPFRDRMLFDDLYLTLFSPDSLCILKHDLRTGVTSDGKKTGSRGHKIRVRGACGQECWQTARSQIFDKFLSKSHCKLVAQVSLSDVEISSWLANQSEAMAALQDRAYRGVPLNHMAPELRGLRIEQIAFEVDQILHPNCSFSRASSKVDWVRGDVTVESKHGQMLFDRDRQCWYCGFSRIKSAGDNSCEYNLFDELWLTIYSPFGLHILRHPGKFDPCVTQGPNERRVALRAPRYILGVKEALYQMLVQMELRWGCQPLATVLWDTGG